MAERPDAYVRKNPGDVIQSNEWNELQVRAREEIRAHRHTGNEDGSLIPRAAIETGAIDGKLIDPSAEVSVRTLTTSGNLTVKGELAVNGKALLGDIADLLATVKGLQDDKLNRRGDTVSGTLRVQKNLLVDGSVGVGMDSPVYTLDVSGSVRLGGFSEADTDEWPRVVWCRRADGTGWDEGLIKHSSARGFFGRGGIGLHIHESRDWGVWSSGWNPLLGVEGGTGNTRIKGRLDVRSLAVVGTAKISDGTGYAVEANYMASGSLTIGSVATSYGGGQKWNASTAALMLETHGSTEIAVHDSGNRLTSLMYCEGDPTNRITIGRDMGWGTTPLVIPGSIGIGTNTPTHRLHVVADGAVGLFESSSDSAYLRLATKEGVDKRVEIIHRPGGRLSFWNNGEDVFNITRDRNVGIGTITPSQKLTVQGDHNAGRDPDSGLLYGGQLAIKGYVCQLDFINTNHAGWAIQVNSLNKMYFIRAPWNCSDLVLDGSGNVGIGTDDPRAKLSVVGTAMISDGTGYAVSQEFMASGSLTIGSTATSYGGGSGWNVNTAGLLLETSANTEIAVHDGGTRVASLMHYEGNAANRITIGRDMGWGTTPLVVAGGIGIGTANPEAKLHLVNVPTDAHGNTLIIGQTSASHMRLGFHDDYTWIQSHCGRPLSLNPVGNNVGIGTTAPTHQFHVVADNAVGLFESSGEMAYLRLSTKEGLGNRVEIANRPGGRLSLWNNGQDVFNITRDGNVGIGTTTPSQKLMVQGGHNAGRDPDSGLLYGGQLAIKSNACQIDFIDTDSGHDDWAIMVNGSKMHFIKEPWTYTNLVLAANGNVGIGTDSPAQQLTITGGLGFANQGAGDKKLYSPKDGLLEWMTHEAAEEPGFAVSHQGQVRVHLNADGNSYLNGGNVGIGTTTPLARLHVAGNLRVEGGDVTVDGAVRAKALQTTLYTAGGGGPLPMSNDNVWRDVGDLAVSVSLSQPATALVFYQITMPGSQHLVTRLAVDNNPIWQTRAITGDTRYWSPSSLWMGALAAGAHVIKVQYRTPTGGTNNPSGDDWQNRTLNVLILGAA